jgi:hypothetical protein
MTDDLETLSDSDLLVDPGGEKGFVILYSGLGNKKEADGHKKK